MTERHDKLAQLAHRLSESGRDSSEVCCCIGNYYGSIGDHIRAIQAFKRALRLDSGCSGAWILLGHEYVELKNPHAAAEMYRRGAGEFSEARREDGKCTSKSKTRRLISQFSDHTFVFVYRNQSKRFQSLEWTWESLRAS